MKKTIFILFFGFCFLFGQNRYEIKSGIVEYDILGTGNQKNHTFSGSSTLYFKDFGNLELVDEIIVQKRGSIIEEERNTYKISKEKLFTADFNDEIIYSQKLTVDEDNPIASIKNRETLTQMGAKFLGVESVIGYKCDVWELGEYKIWLYNSVMLKQISNFMGVEQLQIAKNANFNINIKDDKFKLPNFPVKAIELIIGEGEEE